MSDPNGAIPMSQTGRKTRKMTIVKTVVALVYIAVAIPFLMFWQSVIDRIRERERHLEIVMEIDPVEFLGSGMIGGIRGLMIDYLWVKVVSLEQKREYYEIRPLLEFIQKLQPNLSSTWTFNSWNLANNIVTDYRSAQDKWRWIQQGLDVIEDGKRKIPGSTEVWFQCGWIYYQIICNPSGDNSVYFQQQVEKEQLKKRKAAIKAGEKFDEPIYAIELGYQNLKQAANLKQHQTFSEMHIQTLPFYACVRGINYLLLVRREPDVQKGKELIGKAINEFRYLAGKYALDNPQYQGLVAQKNRLLEFLNQAVEVHPEDEEFFGEAYDEINNIVTEAPRMRIQY